MQRINKYLRNSNTLRIIHQKVFNSQPMVFDHLAHRSFKNDEISFEYTSKYDNFIWMKDDFYFESHNASANWLDNYKELNRFRNEFTDERLLGTPKLFISTYNGVESDKNLKDLKSFEKEEINFYINNPNEFVPYSLYNKLSKLNQYLAWTLVHRNDVNHVAILVNDIESILNKTKEHVEINNPSAPIQISEDKKLLQFSTVSEIDKVQFKDSFENIPTNFVEFIQRIDNRNGFSQKNANIIFNSTKK